MTRKVMQEIRGDAIEARDGRIGAVDDVYFDDAQWTVRYLVVDTGNWLPGRKTLISPRQVRQLRADTIQVDLSREQVEGAPGIERDAPVSRTLEEAHARYYEHPFYWSGPYLWGLSARATPIGTVGTPAVEDSLARGDTGRAEVREMAEQRARESHLRSSNEVVGYAISAADGDLGHVEDFLVDEESWSIAGMVVDTRNWLPGKKVVIPPDAITEVDWERRAVQVRLTRDEVKRAPEASG